MHKFIEPLCEAYARNLFIGDTLANSCWLVLRINYARSFTFEMGLSLICTLADGFYSGCEPLDF